MRDRRLPALCLGLLLGIACGDAPPPGPAPQLRVEVEATPGSLPERLEIPPPLPPLSLPAPGQAPAPPPSSPAVLAAPASPQVEAPLAAMRPLEDLLRLPAASEPDSRPLVLPPATDDPAKPGSAKAERRMHVELGSRTDALLIDPKKARTRTDAGVAVDVGKDTRLKTGVRVEQQTGLEREDPTPTVGIEQRF